jgi:peptidoglycan/xylan/chitin deacetylase (PgdA/CDA1 family)
MRVPILMYHSIDDDDAAACVRPGRFDEQMAYLKKAGYRTIDLDTLYDHFSAGEEVTEKSIVITFDDGYRDNVEQAAPILERYGFCATVYLPTDHLGVSNRWNAADGVPQRPLLGWDEVRRLGSDSVLSFQAHSCSHPKLSRLPLGQMEREVRRCKDLIEERLGNPCHHFAYPYGDLSDAVRDIVGAAGFHTAVTTRWGHNRPGVDLLLLCRIGIANGHRLADFKRVLGEPISRGQYYWRRLKQRLAAASPRVGSR